MFSNKTYLFKKTQLYKKVGTIEQKKKKTGKINLPIVSEWSVGSIHKDRFKKTRQTYIWKHRQTDRRTLAGKRIFEL